METLPKSQLDLLLLAILQDGPRHGYAIIADLRERSGGAFDLAEGTVYPALHRLERQGHITSSRVRVAGRERRVYQLSGAGVESLAVRGREWKRFATGVRAVLGDVP